MKKGLFYVLISLLVLLDQSTKIFLKNSLWFTKNTGLVFGFFADHTFIVAFLNLLILVVVLLYLKSLGYGLGTVFVLSGLFGNFLDRLFLGYVRDFIKIPFWPVFNLADVFLVLGILFLVYEKAYINKKTKK